MMFETCTPEEDANARIALNQLNVGEFARRDGVAAWAFFCALTSVVTKAHVARYAYPLRKSAAAFIFNIGL